MNESRQDEPITDAILGRGLGAKYLSELAALVTSTGEPPPFAEPDGEVGENETVIGVVRSPEVKRFYGWRTDLMKQVSQLLVDIRFSLESEAVKNALIVRVMRLKHQEEVLAEIMFHVLREEADSWRDLEETIGVRAGWRIVTYAAPPEVPAGLVALLGSLWPNEED